MSQPTITPPAAPSKPERKTWEEMSPKERRTGTISALVMIAVVVTLAVAFWPGGKDSKSSDPVAASADYSAASAAPLPPAPLPATSDFAIDVKVMKKSCFGSAGCNVTYQIDPRYTGTASLDGHTYTVVYEITGGEDGPQINNFTIRNGAASYPTTERIGTSSSKAALTAKVTSVSES